MKTGAVVFVLLAGISRVFAQAPEPLAQPTSMIFTGVKSYRLGLAFAAANPAADGYLVLRKRSAITEVPVDGKVYTTGDSVGTAKVVSCGTATVLSINNIIASSNYYFAVFAYNGSGQQVNYKQSNPLTGNVSSAASMQSPNEYLGISTQSASFVQDLHNHINPHTPVPYNSYDETNVNLFASHDTTGGQKVINCVYSGEAYIYSPPFAWGTFSREHTYCHSWMPTNPANNPELPEYNDQHHLFPTDQVNANQVRSNYPLGVVVNPTYTYMGCKFGTDAGGNFVFEPRDQHKGDAARAMFYMAVCYNGVSGNNWKLPAAQDQEILKQWHWQDPPDNWEMARNDFIDSLQGNRNPFVDSVNWVCYIDFSTMNKINNPQPCFDYAGLQEKENAVVVSVFPNPSCGDFQVLIHSPSDDEAVIRICDLMSRNIREQSFSLHQGKNALTLSSQLPAGIYFLRVSTARLNQTVRVVIQNR